MYIFHSFCIVTSKHTVTDKLRELLHFLCWLTAIHQNKINNGWLTVCLYLKLNEWIRTHWRTVAWNCSNIFFITGPVNTGGWNVANSWTCDGLRTQEWCYWMHPHWGICPRNVLLRSCVLCCQRQRAPQPLRCLQWSGGCRTIFLCFLYVVMHSRLWIIMR